MNTRPDMNGWHMAYHLDLDAPTILLNKWQRMNRWDRKVYQDELCWLVRAARIPPKSPIHRARIHVIRGNPPPAPDHDGLMGGLKTLIDILCCRRERNPRGLGFIKDDAPLFLDSLTAESMITKRGQGFTTVEIWEPAPNAMKAAA